ncbi:MFS transporter [Paenibacillus sp. HW567]|uniref:MFS transporter n=1 Tax=Paenibacillus sp. HW567 TaxID=1034769 RepID=UPI00036A9761|nr:MFS transporter [Paenibacillus sp. HW567]
MIHTDQKMSIGALLSIRNYRYLILSQLVSNLGDGVYRLSLVWLMKELTQNAFLMSVLLAAETIPLIIFGLFVGVFVDRGNKKKILLLTHLFRGMLILLIVVFLVTDVMHPTFLIVIAVVLTCFTAFLKPATTVSIKALIPEQQIAQAQSLSQIIQTIISLAAPAFAAFLIVIGMQFAFILNAIMYFIGCFFVLLIQNKELVSSKMSDLTFLKIFDDIKDGINAITKHAFLKNSMIYFALINFVTAPEAVLLPLVVINVSELATLEISYLVGILIGSVLINYLKKFSPIVYICFGISLFSLGIGLFAFDIPLVLQITCVFINGIGSAFVNIKMSTMITILVPTEVLGRASSIISVIVLSAMPISIFMTGLISGFIPLLLIFGIIGLLGFLIVILMMINPHLRSTKGDVVQDSSQEFREVSM